ncbi:hypothetical protein APA_1303 [Pseudanabaena sp. lw0831]|nr:hypothetical protein APA_1303 [Pseudanabaena sp. lw0831]
MLPPNQGMFFLSFEQIYDWILLVLDTYCKSSLQSLYSYKISIRA